MVLEFFRDIDADIFIFGSQVTGDVHKYSNYDIGYDADEKIASMALSELRERLEELPIPGTVDLVDFKKVPDQFSKIAMKGGCMKTKREELTFYLERVTQALGTLDEVLEMDYTVIVRDATIQRFEDTFEIAWKLLKKVAKFDGIEVNSPRQALRASYQMRPMFF